MIIKRSAINESEVHLAEPCPYAAVQLVCDIAQGAAADVISNNACDGLTRKAVARLIVAAIQRREGV